MKILWHVFIVIIPLTLWFFLYGNGYLYTLKTDDSWLSQVNFLPCVLVGVFGYYLYFSVNKGKKIFSFILGSLMILALALSFDKPFEKKWNADLSKGEYSILEDQYKEAQNLSATLGNENDNSGYWKISNKLRLDYHQIVSIKQYSKNNELIVSWAKEYPNPLVYLLAVALQKNNTIAYTKQNLDVDNALERKYLIDALNSSRDFLSDKPYKPMHFYHQTNFLMYGGILTNYLTDNNWGNMRNAELKVIGNIQKNHKDMEKIIYEYLNKE